MVLQRDVWQMFFHSQLINIDPYDILCKFTSRLPLMCSPESKQNVTLVMGLFWKHKIKSELVYQIRNKFIVCDNFQSIVNLKPTFWVNRAKKIMSMFPIVRPKTAMRGGFFIFNSMSIKTTMHNLFINRTRRYTHVNNDKVRVISIVIFISQK